MNNDDVPEDVPIKALAFSIGVDVDSSVNHIAIVALGEIEKLRMYRSADAEIAQSVAKTLLEWFGDPDTSSSFPGLNVEISRKEDEEYDTREENTEEVEREDP